MRMRHRGLCKRIVHARGCKTRGQHAVDVPVLGQRPSAECAVASAHCDYAQLTLERHKRFQNQTHGCRLRAERIPRSVDIGRHFDPKLAFTVVAETSGFQDARCADFRDSGIKRGAIGHVGELRHRNTECAKQVFFGQAVLCDRQRARIREYRHALAQPLRGFGRHILEIEGSDIDLRRELGQCVFVPIIADDQRRELSGAGIGDGVQHAEAQTQRCAGERKHAGQLAAAENADSGHVRPASTRGSSLSQTSCVCFARNASSAAPICG